MSLHSGLTLSLARSPSRTLQAAVTQCHLETEVVHCVEGVLSPLLANIALHVLDEHVMAPWKLDGTMGTLYRRHARRGKGQRRGGSCVTRTTSSCWCTANATTWNSYAKTSPRR